MIISCPECSGKFRIDPPALGAAGRRVRCGKCAHTWLQTPPDPEGATATEVPANPPFPDSAFPDSALPDSAADGPDAPADDGIDWDAPAASVADDAPWPGRRARAATADAAAKRWPAVAAWVALVAVVGALGAGLYAFRDRIMKTWPDTNALYDTFELAPPGFRLVLAAPKWRQAMIGGTAALIVEGRISNPTSRARAVPGLLKLRLLDADRKELQARTFPSPVARLSPDGSAAYKIEFLDPAKESNELHISFVADNE